ncbi:MAG: iron-sulfur cluster assembly accessory protein [Chthonomonas sp.]|nr:iron-sulfur cluster assembly accessory protein [Chthonomonas sp.]
MAITLTDRAASELKALMEEQGQQNAALRVWVAGGGCSGLQYGMALDDNTPEEGDQIFAEAGVKVIIDPGSLGYMTGSIVDFVDDEHGGGFKIENPNAVRGCGCGNSFATEDGQAAGCGSGGCGSGGCGSH